MSSPRRPLGPIAFSLSGGAFDEEGGPHVLVAPPVDVVEDERGWRLVFECAGADASRLSLQVEGRTVTLRGDRPSTEGLPGQYLRLERIAGPFERSLDLPDDPDPEGTRASYVDGLLTVEIPRRESARSRAIPIKRTARTRG